MNKDIGPGRIPARTVSLFLKQFSLLLSSGISLDESLSIIKDQNMDKRLSKALSNILVNLNSGLSAYESFKRESRYFTPMLIAFIKSGDEGGNMAEILGEFSDYLSNDSKNKSQIRQAFIYPIILLIVTITVVALIVTLVMPTFTESFASYGMDLPLSTRMLLAISAFFSEYGFVVFYWFWPWSLFISIYITVKNIGLRSIHIVSNYSHLKDSGSLPWIIRLVRSCIFYAVGILI